MAEQTKIGAKVQATDELGRYADGKVVRFSADGKVVRFSEDVEVEFTRFGPEHLASHWDHSASGSPRPPWPSKCQVGTLFSLVHVICCCTVVHCIKLLFISVCRHSYFDLNTCGLFCCLCHVDKIVNEANVFIVNYAFRSLVSVPGPHRIDAIRYMIMV